MRRASGVPDATSFSLPTIDGSHSVHPSAILFVFCAGLASCGGASASPFSNSVCPVADVRAGYPVSVAAPDHDLPADYLDGLANALARRWLVPSRRRHSYPGAEDVRIRVDTPEPRWAVDWKPGVQHLAEYEVQFNPASGQMSARLVQGSDDPFFDASLETVFSDRPGWEYPLPSSPSSASNVRLTVRFGRVATAGAGVAHFAVQQSPIRLIKGSAQPVHPRAAVGNRAGDVTVKYEVTEDGVVRPRSLTILRSDAAPFSQAVLTAMRSARFRPAQSNCRPVSQSVVQVIEFGRTGKV